ncbi:hypothetical protein BN874_1610012 [Candidatus Contendobacter odensis Run_B_J11]|uniref:Uncharacterized protein n=1 Tax=Candidatus Contendobacter odensis Run_B_J11 TaxID=1400861 RepID=A0A7U7J1Z5_9GAMM|nr:hypothetical protein BN874_1610012 [Candidatus Contendobacter odensis Run_B_J11]
MMEMVRMILLSGGSQQLIGMSGHQLTLFHILVPLISSRFQALLILVVWLSGVSPATKC